MVDENKIVNLDDHRPIPDLDEKVIDAMAFVDLLREWGYTRTEALLCSTYMVAYALSEFDDDPNTLKRLKTLSFKFSAHWEPMFRMLRKKWGEGKDGA